MDKKYLISVLLMVFVVFAGCSGGLEWTLSADIDNLTETTTEVQIDGSVSLGGLYSDQIRIESVSVCALNQSGGSMDTTYIGTFTNNRSMTNYTLTVPHPPEKIVLGYGNIETKGNGAFQGLKLVEGEANKSFYQEESKCNNS